MAGTYCWPHGHDEAGCRVCPPSRFPQFPLATRRRSVYDEAMTTTPTTRTPLDELAARYEDHDLGRHRATPAEVKAALPLRTKVALRGSAKLSPANIVLHLAGSGTIVATSTSGRKGVEHTVRTAHGTAYGVAAADVVRL